MNAYRQGKNGRDSSAKKGGAAVRRYSALSDATGESLTLAFLQLLYSRLILLLHVSYQERSEFIDSYH
jgi:hypothetical protein